MKKGKVINKLYWISIVLWGLVSLYIIGKNYYINLCGTKCYGYDCGVYTLPYRVNEGSAICINNKLDLFYNNNYYLIDGFFGILRLIIFMLSVILLIMFIKNKRIKRVIMTVVILLSSFLLPAVLNVSRQANVIKKPMIYIYPKEEMDITIKLKNDELLRTTYPKYEGSWKIHVKEDGSIYDYNTKRNYYALFWDAKDDSQVNMKEGFIIKGEDTVKFLEEKLEILGLNDKEIEEFIVYWLPEMENNKYNYIRFRTANEINKNMPLEISERPDTLIRIAMDFKPLTKRINLKKQKLSRVTRSGYTIVEWGGRKLK